MKDQECNTPLIRQAIILGCGLRITTPTKNFSLHKLSGQGHNEKFIRPVTQSPRVMNQFIQNCTGINEAGYLLLLLSSRPLVTAVCSKSQQHMLPCKNTLSQPFMLCVPSKVFGQTSQPPLVLNLNYGNCGNPWQIWANRLETVRVWCRQSFPRVVIITNLFRSTAWVFGFW